MALPIAGFLSNALRTEGEMKTAFEDQRDAIAQMPGAGTILTALTIATGAITPAVGISHAIDLRGEGAADDILDNITATNIVTGAWVWLTAGNTGAEDITINHNAGGAGQLTLRDSVDFLMNAVNMGIMMRYNGTDFVELWREYGNQAVTQTAAFRAHLGLGDVADGIELIELQPNCLSRDLDTDRHVAAEHRRHDEYGHESHVRRQDDSNQMPELAHEVDVGVGIQVVAPQVYVHSPLQRRAKRIHQPSAELLDRDDGDQ